MERDFLGLNSKDSVILVEDEVKDGSKDSSSVFMRRSTMQWPFSNKVSALPQLLPFKAVQDDRSKRIDPFASPGFTSIPTADAFDANHKMFNAVIQKNFNLDKQAGTHYPITSYPVVQQVEAAHLGHRPHDIRSFPVSNHTISVSMSNPFFKNIGNNFSVTSAKQQPLGAVPVTTSNTVVSNAGFVTGNSDQRNIPKAAGTSAQLTIFYGGSVSVYDDVSPEKAQAIMFLAGNGASVNHGATTPRAQVQVPIPKPVGGDLAVVHGNRSHSTSPCSGLSSPMSVTSHAPPQSGGGSSGTDEVIAAKSIGDVTASTSLLEPLKAVTSIGTSTNLMPAAVPQARKASLARFLEKRKERVMSTMPYTMAKKSPEGSTTTPASNGIGFCGSTGAGGFIATGKEQPLCLIPSKEENKTESIQTSLEMLRVVN